MDIKTGEELARGKKGREQQLESNDGDITGRERVTSL